MVNHLLRLAHLSDLHFSNPTFDFKQFFSKRWLGNINSFLNREQKYCNNRPFLLPSLFKELNIDCVLITGDLTTTSHPKEYAIAKEFTKKLTECGLPTFLIPGNHDHYTKRAERQKRFYTHFQSQLSPLIPKFNLKECAVGAYLLPNGWILVALDTTLATPFYSSNGLFSKTLESHLKALLTSLPQESQIILINHFPFSSIGQPRRHLKRGKELKAILKSDPRIKLYLHGHTHRQSVFDLRAENLPITLDSGSASFRQGSWNLLDFKSNHQCDLTVYKWEKNNWHISKNQNFQWTP